MTAITKLHSSPGAAVQPMRMTLSREQTAEVAVHTTDEDRVTISSSSESSATSGPGSERSASSTELSVGTQGDLSKKQLKDIEKAIQTFQQVTMDVLYGRVVTAVAHARQMEKLDNVAAIDGETGLQQILTVGVDTKV
jgi:hypothetical protein